MLRPSMYRPFVKGWKPDIFTAKAFDAHAEDRKKYRIYIPFEPNVVAAPGANAIMNRVRDFLHDNCYEIDDYIKGSASKVTAHGPRVMRIGKLLNAKIKDARKADRTTYVTHLEKILKDFSSDPIRSSAKEKSKLFIVFSRHPYDLCGMSTNRGWVSCMNLTDGSRTDCIHADVEYGTIIAYCVREDDKSIHDPICRVLIKPYKSAFGDENERMMIVEGRVYGNEVPGFKKAVKTFLNQMCPEPEYGIFAIQGGLYQDHAPYDVLLGKRKVFEMSKKEPSLFASAPTGSQGKLLANYPSLIRYLGEHNVNLCWHRICADLGKNKAKLKTALRSIEYVMRKNPAFASKLIYPRGLVLVQMGADMMKYAKEEDYEKLVSNFQGVHVPKRLQFGLLKNLDNGASSRIENIDPKVKKQWFAWLKTQRKSVIWRFLRSYGYYLLRTESLATIKDFMLAFDWTALEWENLGYWCPYGPRGDVKRAWFRQMEQEAAEKERVCRHRDFRMAA